MKYKQGLIGGAPAQSLRGTPAYDQHLKDMGQQETDQEVNQVQDNQVMNKPALDFLLVVVRDRLGDGGMKNPMVIDMVMAALRAGGFDGLVHECSECACELDDLAPCGEMGESCMAGWKHPCDCDERHDWHIMAERPKEPRSTAKKTPGSECACELDGVDR